MGAEAIMGIALDDFTPRVRFTKPRLAFTRLRFMREIAKDICIENDIDLADLIGPSRLRPLVLIRHEFWTLVRRETSLSLPQIGEFTGGRDHTTVLHGLRMHALRTAPGYVRPKYGHRRAQRAA